MGGLTKISSLCSTINQLSFPGELKGHVCLTNSSTFVFKLLSLHLFQKLTAKTGKPLFNDHVFHQMNNILKEVLTGYYSDPPGHSFYSFDLDSDSQPKVDKYGLKLICSSHGTSDVEHLHQLYTTTFDNVAGVELTTCMLDEWAHRHNINMFAM